ncbi:hypothetical protein [Pseudoalteromonas xiamenensis]
MGYLEKAGRLMRLMGWLVSIAAIGIFAAIAIPMYAEGKMDSASIGILLLSLLVFAIPLLYFKAGSAIKQGKKWGKVTGLIVATISLLNLPIGTIFGLATLYYLKKGWNEVSESA